MIIKKLSAFLLAAFLAASGAHAADFGQELFNFFVRKMNPEKAELHLQSMPTEKGEIPWAYLECVNANVRGMNIRSLKMDCFDAVITPPAKWKKMEHPYVESMLACHAEGIFTEADVNAFLHDRLFGHEKEWERISVDMRNDRIYAVGWYNANLKVMRVKVKLELSCRIAGRGTALWLEDVILKVNDKKMSRGMMEKALDRIQPFLDMKKYNLPLYLTKIELSDGICRVASRIPPRPLTGGISYVRVKNAASADVTVKR
ncbi:MAG: hypothetical protein J6Z30_03165 [Pyramidobacter sp.]|nr:hypothetical protein [Pyramidobacter sp.]